MKFIIALTLILSSFTTYASTCESLVDEMNYAQLQYKYHQETVEMFEDLHKDANRTAWVSRGLFTASSTVLIFTPLGRGLKFVKGKLKPVNFGKGYSQFLTAKLTAKPVGIGLATLGTVITALYLSGSGEPQFEAIIDTLEAYDKTLEHIDEQRRQIDLNWTRWENMISLGGKAAEQTGKLYKNALEYNDVLRSKVQFLEELNAMGACFQ